MPDDPQVHEVLRAQAQLSGVARTSSGSRLRIEGGALLWAKASFPDLDRVSAAA
jgi:hypothetical protein